MSWITSFVSLKAWMRFSNLDPVSILLKFIFCSTKSIGTLTLEQRCNFKCGRVLESAYDNHSWCDIFTFGLFCQGVLQGHDKMLYPFYFIYLFSNLLRSNENNLIYFRKQLGNKGKRKFSASRPVFSCNKLRGIKIQYFFPKYIFICTIYTQLMELISAILYDTC